MKSMSLLHELQEYMLSTEGAKQELENLRKEKQRLEKVRVQKCNWQLDLSTVLDVFAFLSFELALIISRYLLSYSCHFRIFSIKIEIKRIIVHFQTFFYLSCSSIRSFASPWTLHCPRGQREQMWGTRLLISQPWTICRPGTESSQTKPHAFVVYRAVLGGKMNTY